jgi:hypothetical protein
VPFFFQYPVRKEVVQTVNSVPYTAVVGYLEHVRQLAKTGIRDDFDQLPQFCVVKSNVPHPGLVLHYLQFETYFQVLPIVAGFVYAPCVAPTLLFVELARGVLNFLER